MKYRVKRQDGGLAFWATAAEAEQLVRAGLARTYGTRKRVIGLQLTCTVEHAGSQVFGVTRSSASRRGFFREHIAERFYIFQPLAVLSPAAVAIAQA
jgi:hypothetical protein